jgi:hypothetical protein
MAENLKELRVSNDAKEDAQELRRRMAEDGYLFFRRLQDPDKLRDLRRDMLTVLQQEGWIVAGTDPMDGIADVGARCTEGDPGYADVYHQAYRLESFHRAGHWPEVVGMVETILGRPAMPHPQKIARIWFPKFTAHTTPIHQDFVHFQGNFETYTAWAPVGDCPRELGGLAVLPGSHKVGRVLDHSFSLGAGSLWVDPQDPRHDSDDLQAQWHTTDYEIGDTLIFPALTIHKALENRTEDRLRVSLDNRYQAIGDPIAEHMLEPHLKRWGTIDWDEVYEAWEADDLKYYWKDLGNPVNPRDMSYIQKGFEEAIGLAQAGDERAQLHLWRVMKKDPTSDDARAAHSVLEKLGFAADGEGPKVA